MAQFQSGQRPVLHHVVECVRGSSDEDCEFSARIMNSRAFFWIRSSCFAQIIDRKCAGSELEKTK